MDIIYTGLGVALVFSLTLYYLSLPWRNAVYVMEADLLERTRLLIRNYEIPAERRDIVEFRQLLLEHMSSCWEETIEEFFERLDVESPVDELGARLAAERARNAELNEVNVSLLRLIADVVEEISVLPSADARFQSIYSKLQGAINK